MLSLPDSVRVFVAIAPVDMRKQFDGLANTVRSALGSDPEKGDLFLFANRRRHLIKILFFDGQGYCLLGKRLESGTFPMPRVDASSIEIDASDLARLLRAKEMSHTRSRRGDRQNPMVEKKSCSRGVDISKRNRFETSFYPS